MNRMAPLSIEFVVIITLCSINRSNASFLPCEFHNSINITDGRRNYDGSISYDNITYTPNQFGVVDFIVKRRVHVLVPVHIRGCICEIKKCIRLCCPYGQKYDGAKGELVCSSHVGPHNVIDSIQNEHGKNQTITMKDHFGIIDGLPHCKHVYQEEEFSIKYVNDYDDRVSCMYVDTQWEFLSY